MVREASAGATRTLGGKVERLRQLADAGLPVPPFVAIAAEELEALHRTAQAARPGLDTPEAAAGRVRAALQEGGLDASAQRAVAAALETLGSPARVAVRSSVAGEDSAGSSFAGQMDSFLNVRRADVPARVLDVAASAWGSRALAYRSARQLPLDGIRTGVVLQRMVDARASGILFTVDPLSRADGHAVVSAGLGLGEGVVGNLVECDTFRIDLDAGTVADRTVVPKLHAVVPVDGEEGGTRRVPVEESGRPVPALGDDELAALADLARRAQRVMGPALDLEWAIDRDGVLWLLQARPITVTAVGGGASPGELSIFDNSNVVESYPGLTLPLTFSFARGAYETIFRQAARRLGVPEETLRGCRHVHANLIALIDGRVYYNILHFYRIMTLVPGFEGMLPAWERALGLPPQPPPPAPGSGALRRRALKARVVGRLVEELLGLDRAVAALKGAIDREHAAFRALELGSLSAHQLLLEHERLAAKVMPPFALTVINDLFCQQAFDLVARLAARWQLGDPMELRNQLAAGETRMDSLAPPRSLAALAEMAAASPRVRAALEQERPWEALGGHDETLAFRRAVEAHLAQHGDRMLEELKLETRASSEDPELLLACVRAAAESGATVAGLDRRDHDVRLAAEAKVAGRLAGHPLRRWLFGIVLRRARTTLRHREDLRLRRARAYGMVRSLFSEIGARLHVAGLLGDPRDVFWLGMDEVAGAVRGHALDADLGGVVARRRAAYARYASLSLPGRIRIEGPAAARATGSAPPATDAVPVTTSTLHGTGCAAGRARGVASVVRAPDRDLRTAGRILVAPMTDPGWVFLMLSAAGLIVERGSILSHTAIIGRELGIPTIVGVAGATTLIRDGQEIEMDGASGTVRILEEVPKTSAIAES